MATITIITKKQYEFCDDIKKHIISYLGAKPMKLVNLVNLPRYLFPRFPPLVSLKRDIYKLRMLITKEQYDYERSLGGIKHRKKDTLNRMYVSRKANLIVQIKNYWIKQTNRLDGGIRPLIAYPPNEYNSYIKNYAKPYSKLLNAHNYLKVDNKSKYLASIRNEAELFQARAEKKRQREAYESWLVEYEKKKAEEKAKAKAKAKALKQAKSRERVPCNWCGKELARGSLLKHRKVGGKCYEAWIKRATLS